MNLWNSLRHKETRNLQEYVELLKLKGNQYAFTGVSGGSLATNIEEVTTDFGAFAEALYKANPVVWGCILARMSVFSEARFKYRRLMLGRPAELFGTPDLELLEHPWPGGSTADMLSRAIQDVDLAGNFYAAKTGPNRLQRLRPDWVSIAVGSNSDPNIYAWDINAEIIGYVYWPGGKASGRKPTTFLPQEVAHFAPYPDPTFEFRGMSWLTPAIREIQGDQAATEHKLNYLSQGATPNTVVTIDAAVSREEFEKWVELFKEEHEGVENAYRTIFLGAGSSIEVVGNDLRKVDFKAVTALGENRIAVASGVPGIVVGLSEGLESATYSNMSQARRMFTDKTIRPLWRSAAQSFEPVMRVPPGSQLWYDDRDISYLQDDQKDQAEIQQKQATTVEVLVKAGFEPESAVAAVAANDFTLLKHTGLVSVQLQEPGAQQNENGQLPAPPVSA